MQSDYSMILSKAVEDFLAHSEKNIEDAVRLCFEAILKAEQDEYLGYVKGHRSGKNTDNKRNGYRSGLVQGLQSSFTINVPRDRLGNFQPFFLELLREKQGKYDNLAFSLYSKGLTTRDIEEVFQELFEHGYSKSSISRITSNFDQYRELWQSRPLASDWYMIYIDALRVKLRRETVGNEAFYIVMGLNADLSRDVLGVYNIPEESSEGWKTVLQDIKGRGVKNVLCFVADGLKGLGDKVREVYPASDFQRCLVHKIRNVLSKVRREDKAEIAADFKKVFLLEEPRYTLKEGRESLKAFISKWGTRYRSIRSLFPEEEIEDHFCYLKYPLGIQRMMYTTNWIEALNKKIRRTTKIRGSFPSEESALNLICAYLMEHCEKNLNKYKISSLIDSKDELDMMMKERRKILISG